VVDGYGGKGVRLKRSYTSVATVPRQRRQKSLLALLSLTKIRKRTESDVAFHQGSKNLDIESKER